MLRYLLEPRLAASSGSCASRRTPALRNPGYQRPGNRRRLRHERRALPRRQRPARAARAQPLRQARRGDDARTRSSPARARRSARSQGQYYRSMHRPPNSANNAFFLETLRLTLVHETTDSTGQPQGLELAYATPRAWLEQGKQIAVRRAADELRAAHVHDRLGRRRRARPARRAAPASPARCGSGCGCRTASASRAVTVNGTPWYRFAGPETIDLSGLSGHVDVARRAALSPARQLSTGAELRLTGPADRLAVVCVNGGPEQRGRGNLERVARVARPPPRAAVSGARLRRGAVPDQVVEAARLCVEDARAAVGRDRRAADAAARLLDGRRGRGQAADEPRSKPSSASRPGSPTACRSSRCAASGSHVLHGTLDRWLPGIPGVSPASSRRGFERARALGVEGELHADPAARCTASRSAPAAGPCRCPRAAHVGAARGRRAARFQAGAD